MFDHILVPLDGSGLAESALPTAVYLSQAMHAGVSLLHVVETNAPETVHGERHLANRDEASAYLQELALSRFPTGVQVDMHVHEEKVEDVADAILSHVHELGSDLVIMCTHGSGGLRDMLYGSIAQQVIGKGATPVLLIQPDHERQVDFCCGKILVPLDGDPEHEQGIPVAQAVAQACRANILLLIVVHTMRTLPVDQASTARLLPSASGELLDMIAVQALENLKEKAIQFQAVGISTSIAVTRGDPVQSIIETAREQMADLIIIGTHGKAGINAFWEGSIAARVSSRTHLPLLLVPVKPKKI